MAKTNYYPMLSDFSFAPLYYYANKGENVFGYEVDHVDDGYYVLQDAPGFEKDDISLEYENGYLTMKGEKTYKINGKEKTKNFYTKLKVGNVSEDIKANLENGILKVFVPKDKKIIKVQLK